LVDWSEWRVKIGKILRQFSTKSVGSWEQKPDFLKSKGPPTAGLILAGAAGLGAASLVVPPSLFVVRFW